jgi:hypothetical protein
MNDDALLQDLVDAEKIARQERIDAAHAAGKAPFDRDAMVAIVEELSASPDLTEHALRQWEREYYDVYDRCRTMAELREHLIKVSPWKPV